MADEPLESAEARKKIKLSREIKRVKRGRGFPVRPPKEAKEPKDPNPLHHIQWVASKRKWLVRIERNGRYILNRKYKTIAEAITARDETLATGRAPPRRAVGRPRLHHIQWVASKRKWLVRIERNGRYILNRKYKTIEEAIAARDETLATGKAPPGRAMGRPRNTPISAWIMGQRSRRLKAVG